MLRKIPFADMIQPPLSLITFRKNEYQQNTKYVIVITHLQGIIAYRLEAI